MWKAITWLVIGVVVGVLVATPLYAGKKNRSITEDSDRDGVVEFSVPLYRPFSYVHVCCGCALTHNVTVRLARGPLGFPWVYQRWEVDERATHLARMRKFGSSYWMGSDRTMDDRW